MPEKIRVILNFLVMVLLIVLIDLFTIKRYNVSSGNGNPAFIWIYALIPTAAYFAKNLYKCLKNLSPHWLWTLVAISISIPYNIWGYKHQVRHLQYIRSQVEKDSSDYEVVLHKTQGITIFNNTVYFNYVTLFMLISWILCFCLLILTYKNYRESKNL